MATLNLTRDTFDETVQSNDLVIVDFWAEWCGPCKTFTPIFEKVSDMYPESVFAKVNTEVEQELASHFQIRSIPYIMVFREQVVIYQQTGILSTEQLVKLYEKARELNMDQIRQRLADQNE